jgi:hypothetical protein
MSDVTNDPVLFARKVLSRTVFDHQEPMVRSRKPYVVVTGGRRSGKTEGSMFKAAHTAMTRRGCQVVVTSANETSMRRWVSDFAALLAGTELGRGATVDAEAARIKFANGSEVVGVPPTDRAIRGLGARVWAVVCDEASLCAPSVIQAIRFLLADHIHEGAQAILTGPPMCALDHPFRELWDAGMAGDPDVDPFQWPTALNPKLDHDWLLRERARLNSITAMGELDGQWIEDGLQFYTHALLNRAIADVQLPMPWEVPGNIFLILAADFGVVYDQSVIWMLARAPGIRDLNPEHDGRPMFIGWPTIFDPGTKLLDVVNRIVSCQAVLHYSLDSIGAGAMAVQEVERQVSQRPKLPERKTRMWWTRATTNAAKMASHGLLRWLLEDDRLIFPRDPMMIRQFTGMRFEYSGRGVAIEAADRSVHDDVPDAAALSMMPYVPHGGSHVICLTQDLASHGRVPESPVEPLDLPTVTTGSGLVVYARPPLQSVADMRVALPSGAGPAAAVPDARHDALRERVRTILHPSETE